MAPHSSTLAWKIPWTEEPGGLQSMGSQRVGHGWATSLSLFTFMHWRRKWQPTPVFLPGESPGWGSLVGSVYGVTQSRTRLKWLSSSSSSSSSSVVCGRLSTRIYDSLTQIMFPLTISEEILFHNGLLNLQETYITPWNSPSPVRPTKEQITSYLLQSPWWRTYWSWQFTVSFQKVMRKQDH